MQQYLQHKAIYERIHKPIDVASGIAVAKSIAIGLAGAAQIATIATTKI